MNTKDTRKKEIKVKEVEDFGGLGLGYLTSKDSITYKLYQFLFEKRQK